MVDLATGNFYASDTGPEATTLTVSKQEPGYLENDPALSF